MFRLETKPANTMQRQLDREQATTDVMPIEVVEQDAIVLFCEQRITLFDARYLPAEEQCAA